MNKIKLTGNLVAAPEMLVTRSGQRIYTFCVAVNRPNCNTITDFVPCYAKIVPGDSNDMKLKCLSKGNKLQVEGAMVSRRYEDKYKQKHTVWEVECNEVVFGF